MQTTNDVMVRTSNRWWRWPLVPVASLVVAAVGAIIVATVQGIVVELLGEYSKDDWAYILVYPLIPCGMFGYLMVAIALRVAPSAKTAAGVVMSMVMIIALISFNTFIWTMDNVPRSDIIQTLSGSLAALAGAVVAFFHGEDDAEPS